MSIFEHHGNLMPSLAAPGVVPPAEAPIISMRPLESERAAAEKVRMAREVQQTTEEPIRLTVRIEIANRSDGESRTDAEYFRVAELLSHCCRQGLTVEGVVSHAEVASARRTDRVGRSAERVAAEKPTAARSTEITPHRAQPTTAKQRASAANRVQPVAVYTSSGTLWLTSLTLLAAACVIVAETVDLAYWIGFTLPGNVRMWMLFGIGLVNIILRYQNRGPVRDEQKLVRAVPEAAMRISGRAQAMGKGGAAAGLPRRIR